MEDSPFHTTDRTRAISTIEKKLVICGTASELPNPYPRLLYRELRDRGYEVIDTKLGMLARSRMPEGTEGVIHVHWFGFPFKMRSSIRAFLAGARYAFLLAVIRLRGWSPIVTVHNESAHDDRHPVLDRWLGHFVLGLLARRVLVMSPYSIRTLGERISNRIRTRIRVVPHPTFEGWYGPPFDKTAARGHLGLRSDTPLLLFFGRVLPYKGVPELLQAFAEVDAPDAQLLITGVCQDSELQRHVTQLALADARVSTRLERVPDEEIPLLFSAADWIVLPYKRILNSGVALLAMGYRRPVIAPNLGSLPESLSVENEAAGILYEPDSTHALNEALAEALQMSESERRHVYATTELVARRASISRVMDLLVDVYEEMM